MTFHLPILRSRTSTSAAEDRKLLALVGWSRSKSGPWVVWSPSTSCSRSHASSPVHCIYVFSILCRAVLARNNLVEKIHENLQISNGTLNCLFFIDDFISWCYDNPILTNDGAFATLFMKLFVMHVFSLTFCYEDSFFLSPTILLLY